MNPELSVWIMVDIIYITMAARKKVHRFILTEHQQHWHSLHINVSTCTTWNFCVIFIFWYCCLVNMGSNNWTFWNGTCYWPMLMLRYLNVMATFLMAPLLGRNAPVFIMQLLFQRQKAKYSFGGNTDLQHNKSTISLITMSWELWINQTVIWAGLILGYTHPD